jgi:hypothetical protein
MLMPDDPTEGKNPPEGAAINFWLGAPPAAGANGAPKDDAVTLTISDASGKAVRTLKAGKTAVAGVNRVWWDLRSDPTKEFKLRTPPQYAPDFPLAADGTRKFPTAAPMSVLMPPGTYTVKLTVDGKEVSPPQPLVVRKDPNSTGSEADIQTQTKLLVAIRDDFNAATDLVNQVETVRADLAKQQALAADDEAGRAQKARAAELDRKIAALEAKLFNVTSTGRGQDQLRFPSQLIEKLSHLADVVSLNDFPPTDQDLEVQKLLAQQLSGIREQIRPLLASR